MQYDYRKVYGWMAEGKDVQVVMDNWTTCSQEGLLRHMLNGLEPEHFRLKPRTVKIGNREVEAPVLEPGTLETVWCWDTDYCRPEKLSPKGNVAGDQYAFGLCFATREACQAAHDAFHALLRGESC